MNETSVLVAKMVSEVCRITLKAKYTQKSAMKNLGAPFAPFTQGPLVFELRCPKLRYATVQLL